MLNEQGKELVYLKDVHECKQTHTNRLDGDKNTEQDSELRKIEVRWKRGRRNALQNEHSPGHPTAHAHPEHPVALKPASAALLIPPSADHISLPIASQGCLLWHQHVLSSAIARCHQYCPGAVPHASIAILCLL